MTEPQQQYGLHFGLDSTYAAQVSKQTLRINAVSREKDTIHFAVNSMASEHAMLVAARAEDAMVSTLQRGENAGHTLHHLAGVRVLKAMSVDQPDGRALTLKLDSPKVSAEQGKTLRLVAFLTDSRTGKVLAVAEQPLGR